jgi:uncharacterized protein
MTFATAPAAGLGFKPEHFAAAMATSAAGLWFEVHAENYMLAGGPRLTMLETLRDAFPVSLHGVGMSLASAERPDPSHLAALAALAERCDPFLISEHLAWSRLGERSFPDLLPFPRTAEALCCISRNIDIVQETLGRTILIENPSHYLPLQGHAWGETEFLSELVARTGCGLLLDLNNVVVSAHNLGFAADDYLDAFPWRAVGEFHLAGHAADPELDLLIDSHSARVSEEVWALLRLTLAQTGAVPVLIERDSEVPPFVELLAERARAATCLDFAAQREMADA